MRVASQIVSRIRLKCNGKEKTRNNSALAACAKPRNEAPFLRQPHPSLLPVPRCRSRRIGTDSQRGGLRRGGGQRFVRGEGDEGRHGAGTAGGRCAAAFEPIIARNSEPRE